MSHNLEEITEQLRQEGYRVTTQRRVILDTVCELGGHVTPDAVYERVQDVAPAVDRSTVYRTLHFLHERGILAATNLDGSRLRYEVAGSLPHHHLACRQCGAVQHLGDDHFQPLFDHLLAAYRFRATGNHLTIHGLCEACL